MVDEATREQDSQDGQDAQAASESTAQDAHTADAGGEGKDPKTDDVFPRPYVEELRRENAGYRTRAQQAERELEALREQAAKERQEVEAKVTATEQRLAELTIGNAVVVEATRMGFIDPEDALRLADTKGVTLADGGKVEGVAEALKELAAKKPHLIKGRGVADAGASGSTGAAPSVNEAIRRAAGRSR